jgi:hypothetical protein
MKNLNDLKNEITRFGLFEEVQKRVALFLFFTVVVTLSINLFLLTYLGPKGQEISSVRSQQEELKLENDLLRSKIEDAKTTSNIEKKAEEELLLKETEVIVINPDLINQIAEDAN